jgi:hypothetical protein
MTVFQDVESAPYDSKDLVLPLPITLICSVPVGTGGSACLQPPSIVLEVSATSLVGGSRWLESTFMRLRLGEDRQKML